MIREVALRMRQTLMRVTRLRQDCNTCLLNGSQHVIRHADEVLELAPGAVRVVGLYLRPGHVAGGEGADFVAGAGCGFPLMPDLMGSCLSPVVPARLRATV